MTQQSRTVKEAAAEHDITLALTPGQLLLAVLGIWLLVRFIRGLRY